MALDATVGAATSNAYLTVAQADAFARSDLGRYASEWLAAPAEKKEAALIRAARDMDGHVGNAATGYYAGVQALVFPRIEDVDLDGNPIILPVVQEAAYAQAVYVLANADVIDNAATQRARGLVNFAEPNVSGQVSDDAQFGRMAPRALALLGRVDQGAVIGWIVTT